MGGQVVGLYSGIGLLISKACRSPFDLYPGSGSTHHNVCHSMCVCMYVCACTLHVTDGHIHTHRDGDLAARDRQRSLGVEALRRPHLVPICV